MVISNHAQPPELMLLQAAESLRDKARSNGSFAEILGEFEGRFGDIEGNLKQLDFVSADSAYLFQPQKDCSYEPVVRNIRPGQLATALERGFLPLAHSVYLTALETVEERMNSGESDDETQAESQSSDEEDVGKTKSKVRPFKCKQCGTNTTTKRRLNSHIKNKHGGS